MPGWNHHIKPSWSSGKKGLVGIVSTSPDGITIRNKGRLDALRIFDDRFNFPGWNHHPELMPLPLVALAGSGFNFPGWNHHPELVQDQRILVVADHVSTSPDGITIRNILAREVAGAAVA